MASASAKGKETFMEKETEKVERFFTEKVIIKKDEVEVSRELCKFALVGQFLGRRMDAGLIV